MKLGKYTFKFNGVDSAHVAHYGVTGHPSITTLEIQQDEWGDGRWYKVGANGGDMWETPDEPMDGGVLDALTWVEANEAAKCHCVNCANL